jgi:hypothetical protein
MSFPDQPQRTIDETQLRSATPEGIPVSLPKLIQYHPRIR